jgi:hypothetical protein
MDGKQQALQICRHAGIFAEINYEKIEIDGDASDRENCEL